MQHTEHMENDGHHGSHDVTKCRLLSESDSCLSSNAYVLSVSEISNNAPHPGITLFASLPCSMVMITDWGRCQ